MIGFWCNLIRVFEYWDIEYWVGSSGLNEVRYVLFVLSICYCIEYMLLYLNFFIVVKSGFSGK